MSTLVTVAVAADATEAGEIQEVLSSVGIEAQLEAAAPEAVGAVNGPCRVLVPEPMIDVARDALAEAAEDPEGGDDIL
jgi:hypothetical protein